MLSLVLKRMLLVIPNLIGVVIITFLLTRALPGDPAAYFAGPAATKEAIEQVRSKLGLDKPLIVQFGRYVADLGHLNLGTSLTTGQPVLTELKNRLPASAELTLFGLILSMVDRGAARHSRRGAAGLVDRPYLPRRRDRWRVAAGVLHRLAPGLRVLFPARLGAGAARPA